MIKIIVTDVDLTREDIIKSVREMQNTEHIEDTSIRYMDTALANPESILRELVSSEILFIDIRVFTQIIPILESQYGKGLVNKLIIYCKDSGELSKLAKGSLSKYKCFRVEDMKLTGFLNHAIRTDTDKKLALSTELMNIAMQEKFLFFGEFKRYAYMFVKDSKEALYTVDLQDEDINDTLDSRLALVNQFKDNNPIKIFNMDNYNFIKGGLGLNEEDYLKIMDKLEKVDTENILVLGDGLYIIDTPKGLVGLTGEIIRLGSYGNYPYINQSLIFLIKNNILEI